MSSTHPVRAPSAIQSKTTWGQMTVNPDALINLAFDAPQEPIEIRLSHPLTLGRADTEENEQPLLDLSLYRAVEKGVSRRHLQIVIVADGLFVTDLGSLNGSFLNGSRLTPHQAYPVRDGDEIRLGNLAGHIYF